MSDLAIIKELEEELGGELEKKDRLHPLRNVFVLNKKNRVVGLSLDNYVFKEVPPILRKLTELNQLSLTRNMLTEIKGLDSLHKLETLIIYENKVEDISTLRNLQFLREVELSYNNIASIAPLQKLKNIKGLWLRMNNIQDLSLLGTFIELEKLNLENNELADISFLYKLSSLTTLGLSKNQINDISPLKNLKGLKRLDLAKNLITKLPSWITDFDMEIKWEDDDFEEGFINFYNNPLKNPPIEIVKQGKAAIKRYFNRIKQEGIAPIYEVKVTLVGEGAAGKTSLQKRLLNEKDDLPTEDKRTRGIEIKDWEFKKDDDDKHIAHIWDFGGQDVYYPVHRFFLTENSLFVLLASTRQSNHNFDYWIPTIYQFGGKSPIILGQTCHEGNKVSWNDLGVYTGHPDFNIIKTQALPYYELNLPNENEGLENIRKTIIDQITSLPHYGKGVPRSWVPVRDAINEKAGEMACISFEQFKEICRNSNAETFADLLAIKDCCQFFHDIGVVLWYAQHEELKNWVVLQPEWAMNAVYRIIDDEDIQNRRGNIEAQDFNRLWQEGHFEDRHSILKKMLQVFKIAFPKKHKKGDFIIPARLLSMPLDKKWADNAAALRLEYHYEFMPRGLVNQISAELSRYIVSDDQVWNNAVNFTYEDSNVLCQVEELFHNRKISIKAKGTDARGMIMLVKNALDDINDGYKGVEPEIIVPCPCSECQSSSDPTPFKYARLKKWIKERGEGATVTCNESQTALPISDLLYSVGLPNPQAAHQSKTITLFLASSSELKEDRAAFEIFINRENKRLNEEGIFLKLQIWEDAIDALSKTRLQDEYNKMVQDCDIFISLFFTKVGKYTAEEFDTAFGQFRASGKPYIYTYFKEGQVDINKITAADIESKEVFMQRLQDLGHFRTNYSELGDLKYQFKMQLEKLLPLL